MPAAGVCSRAWVVPRSAKYGVKGMLASVLFRIAAAAATLVVAGCSGADNAYLPSSVAAEYTALLAEATAVGADDTQTEVIRSALDSGTPIAFEQYKQAKYREMECVSDLGFSIVDIREEQYQGQTEIRYLFGGLDEASGDALLDDADTCAQEYSLYVDLAYQTLPTTEELDALREARRADYLACLAGRGIAVSPAAPWDDLKTADYEAPRAPDEPTCAEQLAVVDLG